jgi:flagellar capping protein FliD
MLSNDDLKKLKGVIHEESNTLETKFRGVLREETNSLEKKLRKVTREEVDKRADETELKMEHRFNAVDKRFDNIEKQMQQDREDWSEFFNQAGIFFDEMRNQLAKRIKKLEDNQRISKN